MRKLLFVLLISQFSILISYAVPQPVGTLQRDTIMGVPCQIYLPHNYAERITPERRGFPVLYLQHGMFGCEDDWVRAGRLMFWMDSLLREEMVAEMIIVMPDNFLGSVPPEERAELMARPNVDPNGKPFSTDDCAHHWRKLTRAQEQAYEMSGYWEEHFPQFMTEVERKYWIDTRSKHRAIAGLSMGGFHSMHISHYITGEFDYVGLFSPVILPRETTDLVAKKEQPATKKKGCCKKKKEQEEAPQSPYKTVGFDEELTYSSDVYNGWMTDVMQLAQMPPLYWIGIGRDDFLYVQLQDYRYWLEKHDFEYTYMETPGGHTWTNWQIYLCHFLKACFTRHW